MLIVIMHIIIFIRLLAFFKKSSKLQANIWKNEKLTILIVKDQKNYEKVVNIRIQAVDIHQRLINIIGKKSGKRAILHALKRTISMLTNLISFPFSLLFDCTKISAYILNLFSRLQLLPRMRTMDITRKARDLKSIVLQSRIVKRRWNIDQKDELIVEDVIITISNHEFCAKWQKYTKEIREELDPRDKEYTFPFQTTFKITQYLLQNAVSLSQNPPNQQKKANNLVVDKCEEYLILKRAVFDYVSEVCENVSSISFRLLSKGELTDGEVKAFAVRIILANIQSVLTDMHSRLQQYAQKPENTQLAHQVAAQFDVLVEVLTTAIDEEISQIFNQLSAHYPQAPPAGATASMREVIADVNRAQDEQNNLIFSSDIKIAKYVKIGQDGRTIVSKPQDYTGFVMQVINQAIGITRTIVDEDLTLSQKFRQFNERLFALANTDKKTQNLTSKGKNISTNLSSPQILGFFKNVLQAKKAKQLPQAQSTKQEQQQLEKSLQLQYRIVEQYKKDHKILTAQKIPNHVKQFSHAEIKEGNFRVNSSAVLRIMTKWVESLQGIFEKSEQEIGQRQYLFKDINNKIMQTQEINTQLRAKFLQQLMQEYKNVKVQLNKLKDEKNLFQSYILSEVYHKSSYLKRFSKVREASAQINAIAIEYTKRYLCILIHHLLKAGYYEDQDLDYVLYLNLVVFRVGDLLRSKLQCNERSFINVMNILNQLDNSKEMEGKFKLVRIKNKLNMRDNNILINYMFMGKVQCELQLSVQKMDDRDKHYYEFCHFVYQLTRGKFGVLTECATVMCQHDSIINSSTDAYYRPKCYEVLQMKKRIHKVHAKDKNIYKCVNCGQLKIGENTQLFQQEALCNTCIVKKDGAQQKMREKNDFLIEQKRIRKYGEIEDGDFIVSVSNQKTDAVLKLYKAWKPQDELKLFLVEINEQVLRNFQKQEFQYDRIGYFNILGKKNKKEDLKELAYKLGGQITVQALKSLRIDPTLLQKIEPFFEAIRIYRIQKNLIKQIQFKSEFIVVNDNSFKWGILEKVIQATTSGNIEQLLYRRYKRLDWTHVKNIIFSKTNIESVNQVIDVFRHSTKLIFRNNGITQINLEKHEKLQYLDLQKNKISNIDLKKNYLLKTLNLAENPIQQIDLRSNINLTDLFLIDNQISQINISSNINLQTVMILFNQLNGINISSNINLKILHIQVNKLKHIDVSYNFNLEQLSLSKNQIQQINLTKNTKNTKLAKLILHGNKFKEIDVSCNINLCELTINDNQLLQINLISNQKLKHLNLSDNKLKVIKLDSQVNLEELNLSNNQIQQINLAKNTKLAKLQLQSNKLKEIDVSSNTNLWRLELSCNELQQINFPSNSKLKYLYLRNNKLKEVNLDFQVNLELLKLQSNQLQQINISHSTKLKYLYLNYNKLKEIDFSFNSSLQQLNINSNLMEHVDLQRNPKLGEISLYENRLHSLRLWLQGFRSYDQFLKDQQSRKCQVTIIYRKQSSKQYCQYMEYLREIYVLGQQLNKHNCEFTFQGDERTSLIVS